MSAVRRKKLVPRAKPKQITKAGKPRMTRDIQRWIADLDPVKQKHIREWIKRGKHCPRRACALCMRVCR